MLLVLASACDVPPPPDPPSLALMEIFPVTTTRGEFALVVGDVGTAPSGVNMTVVSLDLAEDVLSGPVARDGSFLIEPIAQVGQVVRMRTELAGQRSAPVDAVVETGPAQAPPSTPCLRVPLALDDVRGEAEIEIANGCAMEMIVDGIRLRRAAPISILATPPIAVPPSSVTTIPIAITEGTADDIVLIDIAGERRAVSVRGSAR